MGPALSGNFSVAGRCFFSGSVEGDTFLNVMNHKYGKSCDGFRNMSCSCCRHVLPQFRFLVNFQQKSREKRALIPHKMIFIAG